jgi:outer membrane protein TolC
MPRLAAGLEHLPLEAQDRIIALRNEVASLRRITDLAAAWYLAGSGTATQVHEAQMNLENALHSYLELT